MTPAGIQKQITLLMTENSILQSLPSNYLKDLSYKVSKVGYSTYFAKLTRTFPFMIKICAFGLLENEMVGNKYNKMVTKSKFQGAVLSKKAQSKIYC